MCAEILPVLMQNEQVLEGQRPVAPDPVILSEAIVRFRDDRTNSSFLSALVVG